MPAFDGLRGLAVLAVLFYHLSDYCPVNSSAAQALRTVLRGGWCGVDLFFVLSGFLITGILLDTRQAENYFRAFYARRMLRIFPVYYLALITVLMAAHFIPRLAAVLPPPHDRAFYFVYLNNWWGLLQAPWRANVIGHFWSLAVEEQFYAFWPLILWRLPRRNVVRVALAGIVLALVLRIALFAYWGPVRDIVENPFCRMDSLLMGALLASFVRGRPESRLASGMYVCAVAAAAVVVAGAFSGLTILRLAHSQLFIFSGLAVAFGGAVLYTFLNRNRMRLLRSGPLASCGKYSYGMYVYHVPILWWCANYAPAIEPTAGLAQFLTFSCTVTALTVAVSKLSFDLFESHFLKLKTRFTARA